MPRRAKPVKKAANRPLKSIDWKRVDELLIAGCLGTEIASHFDMHPSTFYDRVEIEKGMGFTQYSTEKKAKGESIIREVQFLKAIGATDRGDNTMLVWLGKNRLNQKENAEVSVSPETLNAYAGMMKQLDEMQSERAEQKKNKK